MPKKIDKFENERNEVFNKLLNIIGIDTNKKTFYLLDSLLIIYYVYIYY